MRSTRIRLAAAAAAAVCVALLGPAAHASYPGRNGPIVFDKDNGDVFRINVGGGGYKDITRAHGSSETEPSVSPSGKTLAFELETPSTTAEIFTTDMKGNHAHWVSEKQSKSGNYLSFHQPTWSPSGKQIAFVCNTFNFDQICVVPRQGGSARVLYRCSGCALAEPDWGKSNKIVFMHGLDLWIANGKGTPHAHKLHIQHLDNFDAYGYKDPTWAPNGKKFAFTVGDTNEAIDVANAGGSHHKRLIIARDFGHDPTDYEYPAWSPDGKSIALHVTGPGGGKPAGLYTMKADGSGLRKRSGKVNGTHVELFWATR